MLPTIPIGLVPPPTQDMARLHPEIPPIAPVQESVEGSEVSLDQRDPEEIAERLRDEQRRRQRQGHTPEEMAEEAHGQAAGEPNADDPPRQGLWVDVQV
ncbi:aspartate-semialdehyde dehydrogenase [Pseudomonas mangiferae]|uniref:Aspartate-semialdehyde dehydrogenase n=1 Tax=Pseudomonas mangiferae TaxID=2593654 RepID=A0A553H228_9PSED|nr:aspartate-semialdehyde dehydrogenase [Pseudomonas mangiferae]TRX75801.1 aspartate-semialdehyde dehydrogenase [Pseudomonas mangiferae]